MQNQFINTFQQLMELETSLQKISPCDTLKLTEVANCVDMIKQKKLETLRKLVQEYHITKKGEPITWRQPPSMNGRWVSTVYLNGKKMRITGSSEEDLLCKILKHYNVTIENNPALHNSSIEELYIAAVREKMRKENRDTKTELKWMQYYYRYFSTLAHNKIPSLSLHTLEDLTYNLISSGKIQTKRHFNDYKTALNILCGYLLDNQLIKEPFQNRIVINHYKSLLVKRAKCAEEKILSQKNLQDLEKEINCRTNAVCHRGYDYNGLAIKLSMYSGMRVGELVALRWSDIQCDRIHIHAAEHQCKNPNGNGNLYWVEEGTKNEKYIENTGRDFPLYDKLTEVLEEIWNAQHSLKIQSEWVLCNHDGKRLNADAYEKALRTVCKKLGFNVTNNHALRMALNGYILCEKVPNVAARAKMLGHSIKTNMEWYSYFHKDDLSGIAATLNNGCTPSVPQFLTETK